MTKVEIVEKIKELSNADADLDFLLGLKKKELETLVASIRDRVKEHTAELTKAKNQLKVEIEDRKQVENALKKSEEKFRLIAETSNDIIYHFDLEGEITYCSPSVKKILGFTPQEFIGTNFRDYLPDSELQKAMEHFERFRSGVPELLEIQVLSKKGKQIPVEVSISPIIKEGHLIGAQGTTRDITARKKAEEALRESEVRYRSLFESSIDSIYITEKDGIFVNANQSFFDLFGYTKNEMKNLRAQDLYLNYDDRQMFLRELEQKGFARDYLMKLSKKDGTGMSCLMNATVRQADDGSILGYQGIIRDITEMKQTEEALRERKKELENKTRNLEEVNTALKVLSKKREEDKIEIEAKVLSNVKELVEPYLEKLKNSDLNERQRTYADIVESNIEDIISPFIGRLSSKYLHFTPTEIKIANLIRQGRRSKNIADLLHLSTRTIKFHRENIRKKIGIKNNKINLRSHLMSLK